ncbi:MAG TPA: sodium:proton exchanger [Flavobacteriales bacterium]|nr:sodium:proton exchanger [Flavobacteriales bacterium]
MSNNIVIILISSLIILSFFFNMISKKTNIPSVLLLIAAGFGIRVSPWFAMMGSAVDIFLTLNILGVIGLIMIVLEAALDLKITRDKLPLILRAFFISLFLLFVTSGVVGYIIHRSAEIGFRDALLYSIPLSVMSSAIIIPSVARLKPHTKEFMIYESTFSDILGIIIFYMLLDWFRISELKAVMIETAGKIGITIAASVAVTFALTFLFQRLFNVINYFLIFAILLLIYAVGKEFHLSALILILIFGIMINNKAIFFRGIFHRFIHDETYTAILTNIKLFVKDTAFVIRTFFFFFFGLSITPEAFLNLNTYYVVTLILVALYAIRYFNLKILYHAKIFPVLFIAPRGLITILLLFSIPEHLIKDQFEGDITFMVIIATNLIMMFALMRQRVLVNREGLEISPEPPEERIENSEEETDKEGNESAELT